MASSPQGIWAWVLLLSLAILIVTGVILGTVLR
jgi:Ni,Fe-hydrogenase I cytochrome b subunit